MARLVQIAEVCDEIFAGGDAPKGHLSNEPSDLYPIPVYSNGEENDGLYGYTDKARVTKPSVTVSARGTIGYTAIREKPFVPIVRLITLVPNTELINLRFLYYATQNYKFLGSGTSIPQLTVPMLKAYRFSLPDMGTQDKMVSILDNITAMISLRKKQLQKLDDLIKSRFVEMFGELKTNTRHWEILTFDRMTEFITDGEHSTPRRVNRGIYLLSARNVLNHTLQLDDVDYIDQEEYERIAKRVVPKEGDILISCSGTVGRCCCVPAGLKFQMVRSAALIRFKKSILPIFAEYMVTSDFLQEQINQAKTASSQANLFQGKIAKLKGFIPPMELQEQFADVVKQVNKLKSTIQQGLDKFEQMKQALMQKYFGC